MGKKGFSLIEVLIVIVLISILGSASYLVWQNQSGPAPTPTPSKTIEPTVTIPAGTISLSYKVPETIDMVSDQNTERCWTYQIDSPVITHNEITSLCVEIIDNNTELTGISWINQQYLLSISSKPNWTIQTTPEGEWFVSDSQIDLFVEPWRYFGLHFTNDQIIQVSAEELSVLEYVINSLTY